jgi:putative flippase GtrA
MAHRISALIQRVRALVPELAKFGVVGAIGAVVDLGGSALLYGTFHLGPVTSKAIGVTSACVVTYLGSRFWTFRHRENQAVHRELILFIILNGIGLVIAEVVIATTAYAFGARDQIAYNAASVIGTGFGTIFRFWAYRKWVFLAPAAPAEPDDRTLPEPQAKAKITRPNAVLPSRPYPRPGPVPVVPARLSPPVPGEHRPGARLRGTRPGLPGGLAAGRITGQEHREDRRLAPGQDDPSAVGGGHCPGQRKPQASALGPPADAALEDPRH